jgi:hypothetical protein
MSIRGRLARLLPVVSLAAAMSIAGAGQAFAVVTGPGCEATATDTSGGAAPINITSQSVWHVSKTSNLTGEGHAGSDQTYGSAAAGAFGVGVIPIASGTGHGTSGHGSLDVSQYSSIARVFLGVGASDSCSGALVVIVDNVNALDTWVGRASIALIVIGLIGVIAVGVRARG